MSNALIFLETIFAKKPPQAQILIWSTPSKISKWFVDPAQAAVYCESISQFQNVYFGVAYNPDPRGLLVPYEALSIDNIRCRADDTLGITGVWVDLDVLGPGHKKQNLPRSDGEAYEILNAIPLPPSLIVHSGGGLQAYWLLDGAFDFQAGTLNDIQSRRERAAKLAERWQLLVKDVAAEVGTKAIGQPYDVDSTFDLARVFRVPGTLNQKTKPPRPVVINQNSNWRYEIDELEAYLDERGVKAAAKTPKKEPLATGSATNLKLSKDAKPEFNKFLELYKDPEEKKFRQSWDRKRKDLADQSSSGYDLSIATILFNYEWSDQEIVNAIIANHVEHGDDLKLDRPDYYQRTLARAKMGLSQQQQLESEQVADFRADEHKVTVSDKAHILNEVSHVLGVKVTAWVKFMSDPVVYFLEIDNQFRVSVGDGGAVMNSKRFAQAVYNACDIALPGFKPRQWNSIINKLGLAKVIQEPDVTETPAGYCRYYLIKYLAEKVLCENIDEAVADSQPFHSDDDGYRYFFLESFKNFIRLNGGQNALSKGYSDALRLAGCDIYQKTVKRENGKISTKSVWRFPDDI